MDYERPKETVNFIDFSPDLDFVNVGTNQGFKIYSSDSKIPVNSDYTRGKLFTDQQSCLEEGSVKFVQTINNLAVYVRGSEEYPANQLFIYDDDHDRNASKMIFKSEIKGIRLTTRW